MLHHSGKVFLRVASISAGSIPTCYLDILEVEHDGSSKFRGQVRYNYDPSYSESSNEIRVSFDSVVLQLIGFHQSKAEQELWRI